MCRAQNCWQSVNMDMSPIRVAQRGASLWGVGRDPLMSLPPKANEPLARRKGRDGLRRTLPPSDAFHGSGRAHSCLPEKISAPRLTPITPGLGHRGPSGHPPEALPGGWNTVQDLKRHEIHWTSHDFLHCEV
jgi:hypothetical protein